MRTPATRRAPKTHASEISLHMSVAAFLRAVWPDDLPFYHVPNGEKRDPRTAGKLKGMGVRAGVPDFVLHLPRGQVAYIELKAAGGSLSDSQMAFRNACLAHGHGYATARSLDEVERTLARWLASFGRQLRGRSVINAQGGQA